MFNQTCPKCEFEIKYCYLDINEEQTKEEYREYVECPKCKENVLINAIKTSEPYFERDSIYHCLTCGEKLVMRVDRVDGFSWFVCKKCEGKYNER